MAFGVKVTIKGRDKLQAKMQSLSKKKDKSVKDSLQLGAIMVHATAVKEIQRGTKTGREYMRGTKTHVASAPGEAPATDTGNLVGNILVETKSSKDVRIVSRAKYSASLEYGTKNMEPRPFLHPAYEENKDKIMKLIKKAVSDA